MIQSRFKVTGGDDDDDDRASGGGASFVVEDNTNMFHGLYRQSRENPLYLSDPELSPDEAPVDSRTYLTTLTSRSQRRGATNATSVVDDFDRSVKISRGGTFSSMTKCELVLIRGDKEKLNSLCFIVVSLL